MSDRVAMHLEMARRMYEPQATGYLTGELDLTGAWSAGGVLSEAYEMELFIPGHGGERTVTSTCNPDTLNAANEFKMYWNRIPDFRISHYRVFPHDEGWIAKLIYEGTSIDGETVRGDQVDIVFTDERNRIRRLEWHHDVNQWLQILTVSTGKSLEEIMAQSAAPDGYQNIIEEMTQ